MQKPSYIDFNHDNFKNELSTHYDLRGEIGVLSYPYSKKVSKLWKFKTVALATTSANDIQKLADKWLIKFNNAKTEKTMLYCFIRADICRKFLLMGYTRSMRYFYHKSGKKWQQTATGQWKILPFDYDLEKKKSAQIFYQAHIECKTKKTYIKALQWYKTQGKYIEFDYNLVK